MNPFLGPMDEQLATDTLLVGKPKADNLIIVISGTHGLEGLAGSGVQIGLLRHLELASLRNTALLFVHALNPWGVAYRRRQNEDNIDLNRNFLNFSGKPVENDHYDSLHPIIFRPDLFIDEERNPRIARNIRTYVNDYGDDAFHRALFQGQSKHASGVGYCGTKPAWSNSTIRDICRRYGKARRQVAIVDLHTGLGPHGHGTVLVKSPANSNQSSLVQSWFGDDFVCIRSDHSMPYVPVGDMMSALTDEFDDQTNVVSVVLEFGTFSTKDLMQLQIDDTWLHAFGNKSSGHGECLRQRLQEFFYPESQKWRQQILQRSEQVVIGLIQALSE